MEFIDLAAQQARIRHKIDARIRRVLDHGKYIMGPEVFELEAQLCSYVGARHCITCASGTDALLMPLMAWEVCNNDAVFLPPFTFFATAEMPALLGATPVFVDIDPATFTMRPDLLQKAIEAVLMQDEHIYPLPGKALEQQLRPKAVIPVDLFGQAARIEAILPIASKYGLAVLEDAAQAFGASRHGRKTCALGCDAAATSFFPAKPLGCYGDGGAIFTDSDELANTLRSIRIHGKGQHKYDNVRLGINGRLDTIQAAILLAKLEIFPGEIELRQQVANCYANRLSAIPGLTLPSVASGNTSVWAQYCVLLHNADREHVMRCLQEAGIPSAIYYPKAQHALTVFEGLGYPPNAMPFADAAARQILALPCHPYMSEEHIERIASVLQRAMQ